MKFSSLQLAILATIGLLSSVESRNLERKGRPGPIPGWEKEGWGSPGNYVKEIRGKHIDLALPEGVSRSAEPEVRQSTDLCKCGSSSLPSNPLRIVGGNSTQNGQFPWRCWIYIGDNSRGYTCGATIITPIWMLTAAHCFDNFKSGQYVEVRCGDIRYSNAKSVYADKLIVHGSYDSNSMKNDIALLRLRTSLNFSSNIGPACLPFNYIGQTSLTGKVQGSGWGDTQEGSGRGSSSLLRTTLDLITNAKCISYLGNTISGTQCCTYTPGRDTCQGDSGGSIDYQGSNSKYYAFGIVSYGYGCARDKSPGVYTRVSEYIRSNNTWIQNNTGVTDFCTT